MPAIRKRSAVSDAKVIGQAFLMLSEALGKISTLLLKQHKDPKGAKRTGDKKRAITSYQLFIQQKRQTIIAACSTDGEKPDPKEIMKEGGRQWSLLSESQKNEWKAKAQQIVEEAAGSAASTPEASGAAATPTKVNKQQKATSGATSPSVTPVGTEATETEEERKRRKKEKKKHKKHKEKRMLVD